MGVAAAATAVAGLATDSAELTLIAAAVMVGPVAELVQDAVHASEAVFVQLQQAHLPVTVAVLLAKTGCEVACAVQPVHGGHSAALVTVPVGLA